MALLAAIETEGSITAAAKAVGLSYKAAWDAVDTMNNLAGEALVLRVAGGQGGGGATLTPKAKELIALYRTLDREHQRFMAQLANISAAPSRDLELLQHMMIQTSARNKLAGVVRSVAPGAVNDEVTLDIGETLSLVATITHESVESLGLREGRRVLAFIKASSVMVGLPTAGLALSARNQLQGRICRILPGAVNTEVSIELDQGIVIAAMVSSASVAEMSLHEEQAACAIFKASSVILGTVD